jgi:hypothetical protein
VNPAAFTTGRARSEPRPKAPGVGGSGGATGHGSGLRSSHGPEPEALGLDGCRKRREPMIRLDRPAEGGARGVARGDAGARPRRGRRQDDDTGVGTWPRTCRVISRPERPGIKRRTTRTRGARRLTAVTTSRPSPHWPMTRRSGSVSISARRASRRSGWSWARTTVVGPCPVRIVTAACVTILARTLREPVAHARPDSRAASPLLKRRLGPANPPTAWPWGFPTLPSTLELPASSPQGQAVEDPLILVGRISSDTSSRSSRTSRNGGPSRRRSSRRTRWTRSGDRKTTPAVAI